MSDHWEFFPCTLNDERAFIFVDVGIAEAIDQAPPTLVKVRLVYQNVHENGLPMDEDFGTASAIEDRLEEFALNVEDWYVGRLTAGGHRDFYFYTNQSQMDWATRLRELTEETGFQLKIAFRDDPDHEAYLQDLHPTEDDWQVIKDLRVIETVAEHGDDGHEARPIDHWTYFNTQADAAPFIAWAESEDFLFQAEHSHTTDSGEYCVRLQHEGTLELDDITNRTIALARKAAECGGRYDGWETPVIKTEDSIAE